MLPNSLGIITLPKFNSSPLKKCLNPIGKQSSNHHFFRDEPLNFGRVSDMKSGSLCITQDFKECTPKMNECRSESSEPTIDVQGLKMLVSWAGTPLKTNMTLENPTFA